MASTTVKSSGGDYTTLSAWEADKNGDMVTATEGETATCFDFNDTTECVLAGGTADATYHLTIQTDDDHGGAWNETGYIMESTSSSNARLTFGSGSEYTEVYGVQFQANGAGAKGILVNGVGAAGQIVVSKCIAKSVYGTETSGSMFIITSNWAEIVFVNCLAYDAWIGFQSNINSSSNDVSFYNCGSYGMVSHGFRAAQTPGSIIAKNCWSQSNGGNDYNGTTQWDSGTEYNASDDGTEPGTNGQQGTISFVSAGTDFHLAASGADTVAQDNGTDLSGDGVYPFSDDIDGDTRTFWSIGPDDGSASGGATRRVMVVS